MKKPNLQMRREQRSAAQKIPHVSGQPPKMRHDGRIRFTLTSVCVWVYMHMYGCVCVFVCVCALDRKSVV